MLEKSAAAPPWDVVARGVLNPGVRRGALSSASGTAFALDTISNSNLQIPNHTNPNPSKHRKPHHSEDRVGHHVRAISPGVEAVGGDLGRDEQRLGARARLQQVAHEVDRHHTVAAAHAAQVVGLSSFWVAGVVGWLVGWLLGQFAVILFG